MSAARADDEPIKRLRLLLEALRHASDHAEIEREIALSRELVMSAKGAAPASEGAAEAAMKPDSARHDPRPEYLRALVGRAGITQEQAARAMAINPRTLRRYLDAGDKQRAPYLVQFALEALARAPAKPPRRN